jgi:hypothetical protein
MAVFLGEVYLGHQRYLEKTIMANTMNDETKLNRDVGRTKDDLTAELDACLAEEDRRVSELTDKLVVTIEEHVDDISQKALGAVIKLVSAEFGISAHLLPRASTLNAFIAKILGRRSEHCYGISRHLRKD